MLTDQNNTQTKEEDKLPMNYSVPAFMTYYSI
uniref:Uncharacterized protein n=1 Tax=Anguilla anguilla TaxID=7936 RepID=A0A0E9W7E4_ANGAN